jgi:hypothetical protein
MPPCSLLRLATYVQELHSGCHTHHNRDYDGLCYVQHHSNQGRRSFAASRLAINTTASNSSNAT